MEMLSFIVKECIYSNDEIPCTTVKEVQGISSNHS